MVVTLIRIKKKKERIERQFDKLLKLETKFYGQKGENKWYSRHQLKRNVITGDGV